MNKTDEAQKLRLNPYEFMTLMGASDPCFSRRLKAALDEELTGAQYESLSQSQALGKAMRYLAENKPDSFDPDNRDDAAALRLAPVLVDDDGNRVSSEEFSKRVESADSVQVVTHDKGDRAILDITAEDDHETLSTRMAVKKLEPEPEDPDAIPVVQRRHADPELQEIEDRLLRLKGRVLSEEDFGDSFGYFMDEFAENKDFLKHGSFVTEAPQLEAALEQIAKKLLPGKPKVSQLLLRHLERHYFLHGAAMVCGRVAMVFFFQDLGFGMTAFCAPDGDVHYVRVALAAKPRE